MELIVSNNNNNNNLNVKLIDIQQISTYAKNAKIHSESQIAKLVASLKEFGWTFPILTDENNEIIAGHGRLLAAQRIFQNSWKIFNWDDNSKIPVLQKTDLSATQKKAYRILDNKVAEFSGWDNELLALELNELQTKNNFNVEIIGFDENEINNLTTQFLQHFQNENKNENENENNNEYNLIENELNQNNYENSTQTQEQRLVETLAEKFMVAPFTIFDAKKGWWAERKRQWIAYGLKSEEGRDENLCYSQTCQSPEILQLMTEETQRLGLDKKISLEHFLELHPELKNSAMQGTSIFDPVLCEVVYRWFAKKDYLILDPFAGGSVRGIVAAKLQRHYIGVDIRQEQITENKKQWQIITQTHNNGQYIPLWLCGDSNNINELCKDYQNQVDFIFSCPPYANLEVYSNDPNDISNMPYDKFLQVYRSIIKKSVSLLKQNRFACFVVGNLRDKKSGNYYDLVGDTIQAFADAGMHYYNEAVLLTPLGSAVMRAKRQFLASRKLTKVHQNVLFFIKGDAKIATAELGEVEVCDEILC